MNDSNMQTRSLEFGLRCENSIINTPEQTTSDMSANVWLLILLSRPGQTYQMSSAQAFEACMQKTA